MFGDLQAPNPFFFISYFKSSFIKINIGSRTTFIRAVEMEIFEGVRWLFGRQKWRHNLNGIDSFKLGLWYFRKVSLQTLLPGCCSSMFHYDWDNKDKLYKRSIFILRYNTKLIKLYVYKNVGEKWKHLLKWWENVSCTKVDTS